MLHDTVVIEGEVSLINQIDGDPDVVIAEGGGIVPSGTLEITENGTYNVTDYAQADVDVQGGITPTGTKQISITANGTVTEDVTDYASAEITTNVPASAVDTGTKNISTNGTHDVVGYANASVNVPNSYSASDEGKVVSNGALVSQTSDTVTENGVVDTTLIDELTVNVSGGSSVQTASGTVTGSGNATQTVVCPFEPDVVKIYRSDIASIVAVADRCLASLYISKQGAYSCLYTNANAAGTSNGGHGIFEGTSSWTTGLNVTSTVYARYENGIVTIGPGSGQRYSSDLTYKYEFIKY